MRQWANLRQDTRPHYLCGSRRCRGGHYEWSESEMEAVLGKKDAQKFFHALPTISKNNSKKLPQIIESSEISVKEQLRFFLPSS